MVLTHKRDQADDTGEWGARLAVLAQQVGLEPGELIDALEALAASLPDREAGGSLTAEEDRVYRSVGGRAHPLPPLAERASTVTWGQDMGMAFSGLSVAEAAERLRVSPGRVRQRIGEGSLRAVKRAGSWRVLASQFTADGEVPGIGMVVSGMARGLPALSVDRFLTLPTPDLVADDQNVSPVQWLLGGGDPAVVAAIAAGADILP